MKSFFVKTAIKIAMFAALNAAGVSIAHADAIYLPIAAQDAPIKDESTVWVPTMVAGYTFTYTSGATCTVKTEGVVDQTVISDSGSWCAYYVLPGALFDVTVEETSDDATMPGAMWAFTCRASDVTEEYPQVAYGVGCQR